MTSKPVPSVTYGRMKALLSAVDVSDATTTSKGVVELAADGEATAGVAVQGNDSRLASAMTHAQVLSRGLGA